MSHAPTQQFDPTDPHHAQSGHGHVILSWQLLVGILFTLLCLTALTVFTAQAEKWVMLTWGITLPTWVNLAGAMSIATVKALLVMAFFMQLKYDKPINSIIMVACVICVWLFLMFCMIDLGNRDKVQAFKAQHFTEGGTGYSLSNGLAPGVPGAMSSRLSPHVNTSNASLPEFVFQQALTNFPDADQRGKKIADKYFDDPYYTENTERAFWHWYYDYTYVNKGLAPHHHNRDSENYYASFLDQNHDRLAELGIEVHHDSGHAASDANLSRPRHGLTVGLFDAAADHGDDSHEATGHEEPAHAPAAEPPVSNDH
ncbi:MAG: cytochrome c oxidase subunit 4 [Phycisphaerales bacterium]|jgi:cytochrome c oxidase subunit 4